MVIHEHEDRPSTCDECGQQCRMTVALGKTDSRSWTHAVQVCLACLGLASTMLADRATAKAKGEAGCESK